MAGRTFDLFPRKLFIALNMLFAMRAGELEFAHKFLQSCLVPMLAAEFERLLFEMQPNCYLEWTFDSRFKSNSTGASLVFMTT